MLTEEDFINAGYRKFKGVGIFREYASHGLQKLISDGTGKRYYITVYVYDNREFRETCDLGNLPDFTFEPNVQFSPKEDKMYVDVKLVLHADNTVEDIEKKCNLLWEALDKPYYELWI